MKESLTLIGIIALILFLFSLPSCNPIDTNVYECTISYTIGDNPYQFTETVMIDLPTDYTPAYSCGSGKITLIGDCPVHHLLACHCVLLSGQVHLQSGESGLQGHCLVCQRIHFFKK